MFDIRKILTASAIVAASLTGAAAQAQEADATLGEAIMMMDGTAGDAGIDAATGWHTCDVVRTGAGWGNHYVALTCSTGPFTNRWHIMTAAQMDAMLATALAAATADERVQVNIGPAQSGSSYNVIRALYLHK